MTWKCEVCGHRNPGSEQICTECGAYRQESAYDAIADEDDDE